MESRSLESMSHYESVGVKHKGDEKRRVGKSRNESLMYSKEKKRVSAAAHVIGSRGRGKCSP